LFQDANRDIDILAQASRDFKSIKYIIYFFEKGYKNNKTYNPKPMQILTTGKEFSFDLLKRALISILKTLNLEDSENDFSSSD